MELLWENTVRTSIVLAVGLIAVTVLRGRAAALRHWILATSVIAALALPAVQVLLPRWNLPFVWTPEAMSAAPPPVAAAHESLAVPSSGSAEREAAAEFPVAIGMIAIWTAGMVFVLLHLGAGLVRLAWQTARANIVTEGRSAALLTRLRDASAVRRRVRLLYAPGATPMTWGWRRPSILLPPEADTWSDERLRIVLLHELAHIRRGDWPMQLAATGLQAAYWFTPLPWFAARRLRTESELACDDVVLAEGIAAPEYATHLLDLARLNRRRSDARLPAATIARASSFERRFRAMLNSDTNRTPMTRRARSVWAAAIAAVCLAAGALSSAQTFSTFSGSVFDATNRLVPSVTISLINNETGTFYSLESGPDGRFQFVGLPPGDYQFETTGAGFETLRGTVSVSGRNVEKDLVLNVGELEETVTIVASASEPSNTNPQRLNWRSSARSASPQCVDSAIGGNITPPRKLVNVNPVYPEAARASGISGVVLVEALIGRDGLVQEVGVVESAHPSLLEAALEAIRQWEFSQTLLNCEPSEVRMRVTAKFVIEP